MEKLDLKFSLLVLPLIVVVLAIIVLLFSLNQSTESKTRNDYTMFSCSAAQIRKEIPSISINGIDVRPTYASLEWTEPKYVHFPPDDASISIYPEVNVNNVTIKLSTCMFPDFINIRYFYDVKQNQKPKDSDDNHYEIKTSVDLDKYSYTDSTVEAYFPPDVQADFALIEAVYISKKHGFSMISFGFRPVWKKSS